MWKQLLLDVTHNYRVCNDIEKYSVYNLATLLATEPSISLSLSSLPTHNKAAILTSIEIYNEDNHGAQRVWVISFFVWSFYKSQQQITQKSEKRKKKKEKNNHRQTHKIN